MSKHPILEVEQQEETTFLFEGKEVKGERNYTIAATLHQAGYPVHSHSLKNRNRSLVCGIGKCGACKMLVDGKIKRICITRINDVKVVREIPKDSTPEAEILKKDKPVKAIIEARPNEGGFPVQANRVRRLGIPVILSHILLKAIPNKNHDGIVGAVVAECENFKPVLGTEKVIDGIDAINICTGLVSDDALLIKGKEIFGRKCFGAGDAIRIGEGTSAVVRGQQVAYEILEDMQERYDYNKYLSISKEYIDSQQHPVKVIEQAFLPTVERESEKPFVLIDCLYGFACNPCEFACPHDAIKKPSTSNVPLIDFTKCIVCMACVYQCPGLAIFGYNTNKNRVFLPIEFDMEAGKNAGQTHENSFLY